jgi:hypothetical protein
MGRPSQVRPMGLAGRLSELGIATRRHVAVAARIVGMRTARPTGTARSGREVPWTLPGSGSLYLAMDVSDQPVNRLKSYDPFPPVWRMRCLCSFRAGKAGEIAACGCRLWWRVGRRGRWYAISRRRALSVLARELRRELDYFDVTGNWSAGLRAVFRGRPFRPAVLPVGSSAFRRPPGQLALSPEEVSPGRGGPLRCRIDPGPRWAISSLRTCGAGRAPGAAVRAPSGRRPRGASACRAGGGRAVRPWCRGSSPRSQ